MPADRFKMRAIVWKTRWYSGVDLMSYLARLRRPDWRLDLASSGRV